MTIAAVHAAGWLVEELRERRGAPRLWPNGHWYAAIRDRTGERIESGAGVTADAALAAALASATEVRLPADLSELLG